MATSILVLKELRNTVPGTGTVRLGMDFGNLNEIRSGDLIASCEIETDPVDLVVVPLSTEITDGYLVTAVFTGGAAGPYSVTFTPTLVSGQQLPPRTGTIQLEAPP